MPRLVRMPLVALLLLAFGLAGCGGRPSGNRPASPPPEDIPLAVCPVEGTKFPAGTGVAARGGGRTVEVCSPGCRYRFETEPGLFPAQDRGR